MKAPQTFVKNCTHHLDTQGKPWKELQAYMFPISHLLVAYSGAIFTAKMLQNGALLPQGCQIIVGSPYAQHTETPNLAAKYLPKI